MLGILELSTGGISGTIADLRHIFAAALKANATGIVLAHNHPSGDTTPSKADEDLTRKIKTAGQFLEIAVLDHFIVTNEEYFSFADHGLL